MDPFTSLLLQHGPAGILAVVIGFLFRAKEAQTVAYQAEIKRLYETHQAEMAVLTERHLIRSEKWADKGQAIAQALAQSKRSKTLAEGDAS